MHGKKILAVIAAVAALALVRLGIAQQGRMQELPSWAPKPVQPSKYFPPHKPHTKLVDLKAKHKGHADWRELLVDDDHLHAEYISTTPGTKVSRRFHPDTREWWVVMAGQIRYPIENQGVIIADQGDVVYVPIMTFHAPRFHGPGPSCRLAMNGYPNISHLRDAVSH